jgi:hypothetical protein
LCLQVQQPRQFTFGEVAVVAEVATKLVEVEQAQAHNTPFMQHYQ